MPLTTSFLKRYWLVLLVVGLITLAHYNTAFHIHALHGIYRRLYYFPIILAAFRDGTRGGVVIALLVCGVYLPSRQGIVEIRGGVKHHFCSERCRRRFLEESRPEPRGRTGP